MDQTEAISRAQRYLKDIRRIIPFESAWLFGSYARKQQRDDSDIDIGIIVKTLEEDYFSIMKKMYQIRRHIDVRIEPHLFVVDKDTLEFSREVEKTGIRLS